MEAYALFTLACAGLAYVGLQKTTPDPDLTEKNQPKDERQTDMFPDHCQG